LAGLAALALAGCGGGASPGNPTPTPAPAPTPTPTPTPTPPTAPDFGAVEARIKQFPVNDVAVLIGDSSGALYRFERGSMGTARVVQIASASKMVFGLLGWQLIEQGKLARGSRPADVLGFWAKDAADPRSQVTLDQLLGFTSGFVGEDREAECIGDAQVSLAACVQQIHDGGLANPPGSQFDYGASHMQIAALMFAESQGKSINQLLREVLFMPLGVSSETRYSLLGDNARYGGGLRSSADDYALLLTALVKGDLAANRAGYLADRTAGVRFGYRPPTIGEKNLDWHYGFGFWKECDAPVYSAACEAEQVISSTGAFGFTPWVDFKRGYWAIIAIEESAGQTPSPGNVSVTLEQALQPLIADALNK